MVIACFISPAVRTAMPRSRSGTPRRFRTSGPRARRGNRGVVACVADGSGIRGLARGPVGSPRYRARRTRAGCLSHFSARSEQARCALDRWALQALIRGSWLCGRRVWPHEKATGMEPDRRASSSEYLVEPDGRSDRLSLFGNPFGIRMVPHPGDLGGIICARLRARRLSSRAPRRRWGRRIGASIPGSDPSH